MLTQASPYFAVWPSATAQKVVLMSQPSISKIYPDCLLYFTILMMKDASGGIKCVDEMALDNESEIAVWCKLTLRSVYFPPTVPSQSHCILINKQCDFLVSKTPINLIFVFFLNISSRWRSRQSFCLIWFYTLPSFGPSLETSRPFPCALSSTGLICLKDALRVKKRDWALSRFPA